MYMTWTYNQWFIAYKTKLIKVERVKETAKTGKAESDRQKYLKLISTWLNEIKAKDIISILK